MAQRIQKYERDRLEKAFRIMQLVQEDALRRKIGVDDSVREMVFLIGEEEFLNAIRHRVNYLVWVGDGRLEYRNREAFATVTDENPGMEGCWGAIHPAHFDEIASAFRRMKSL